MSRVPKTRVGQFFFFAVAEFISYFVIVANTRAFTQGSYLWTAVTDSLFTMQAFVVAKLMIDDPNGRSFWAGAGCTIGGTLGSLCSIYVTKKFYGA